MTCNLNPHIERWISMVEAGEIEACEDQHNLAAYVKKCFDEEDIYTDGALLEKYLGLSRYLPFDQVFEWEAFCMALHLCTFWSDTHQPRWSDLLLLIGRGAGKDGYIAHSSFAVSSPYNPIVGYDVDICANAEEQAMRPVNDLLGALENPSHYSKIKKHYAWTKESITSRRTNSVIKGRTNNPKSKDGMRSGMVVFNEIHQYLNYDNIKVFVTGLGKKPHPRILYATTNGDVRDGPLDELIARSEQILKGEIGDNGLLPFICRLDDKDEANAPEKWEKANPSLRHLPHLRKTIEKEYEDWKQNPPANADFMTKRMNLPQSAVDIAVTDYDNIKATNRPLPEMRGWSCICGIDYAKVTDFASVDLHFRNGQERYDINHSWLCLHSADLHRIKAPWREWAEEGYLTLVDDVEINPDLLCAWILNQSAEYQIECIGIDSFRYALMSDSLRKIGFDAKDFKNVFLVRPSDIMRVQPVIDSAFVNQQICWGDNPPLRWATNNTKLVKASKKIGSDTGNYYYAKIEARSRKTDPFMAFAAAMALEDKLPEDARGYVDLPLIIGR